MAHVIIDWNAIDEVFDTIYALEIGEGFKFTKNIETLYLKIQERLPNTLTSFNVKLALPGTSTYTENGENYFVVIEKVVAP